MFAETFIRNLGLIIVAAAGCSLVMRRVQLPTILAYLVAGLVLGPWTGMVEVSGSLELISEIGIVLLLFLVGMELSFEKIRGMGKAVLIAGLAQMIFTMAGGWALATLLGFKTAEAVFLAVALTFSSTVVAVKLLEEKGEFNATHGRMAVGVLLLQDLGVIVLLTLMGGFKPGESLDVAKVALNLAKAFGGMALLMTATLLSSRYLLPKPFGWAARNPATLLIWCLCWCFFVVAAAHALHLSPETGAFLAGLALAQLPFNEDLRHRVHPLMNFFVAVFFVSLGVNMKLGEATSQWPIALAFALFVLLGKLLIVAVTVARLGFSARSAWGAGVTLSQISEFSFILAATGVAGGWIGTGEMSMIGLVGLVTISLSSCAIIYNEPLYRAATRLGLTKVLRPRVPDAPDEEAESHSGHIIVVGMNTLGRKIAAQLAEQGERVLAIDTDPHKLKGLNCETMHGNVEYLSVLEEAGLEHAKLLVSALRIEPTNDLLAYRCRSYGVPCSVNVVDLSVTDNLVAMDAKYLMTPKVDGVKLQAAVLKEKGFLPS